MVKAHSCGDAPDHTGIILILRSVHEGARRRSPFVEQSMSIICPHCSHGMNVKGLRAGRFTPKCSKCGQTFLLVVTLDPEPSFRASKLPAQPKPAAAQEPAAPKEKPRPAPKPLPAAPPPAVDPGM